MAGYQEPVDSSLFPKVDEYNIKMGGDRGHEMTILLQGLNISFLYEVVNISSHDYG